MRIRSRERARPRVVVSERADEPVDLVASAGAPVERGPPGEAAGVEEVVPGPAGQHRLLDGAEEHLASRGGGEASVAQREACVVLCDDRIVPIPRRERECAPRRQNVAARRQDQRVVPGAGGDCQVLQAGGVTEPLNPVQDFARRIRERYVGFQAVDVTPALTDLRMIKTAYERKILVKSLEISSDAQMAGMRAARPGGWEYEVEAAIEAVHRSRGAVSWSYPSIVASGPNATILHYSENSRQMQAGELLLVDAAANYDYMSGDITRTYPINGTFSQTQKDIYAIVLQAQDEAIKVARAGTPLTQVHDKTVDVIKAGREYEHLATNQMGETCMATPAISEGLLFIRGKTHLYCIGR